MKERIDGMISRVEGMLLDKRGKDGFWRGYLSSSAISTSVALFALAMKDPGKYSSHIGNAAAWLKDTMKEDGTWGDSPESPSNMTATLLSYTALKYCGKVPRETETYLIGRFGSLSEDDIIKGVLDCYGKDLTFSVPILSMCALCGTVTSWDKIPAFPYELAALPQKLFRFLQLPVVSYAIPALIAVGILRGKMGKKTPMSSFRTLFIPKCLKVLTRMQPEDGGFLEAAPLTGFVLMCMCASGLGNHPVAQKAASFLSSTVRSDGSWPIDSDLSTWVSTLSIKALGDTISNKEEMADGLKGRAIKKIHPFTNADPGGWGWTDLSGSVPDADDTPGALIALHMLSGGKYSPEAEGGVRWLLGLQNYDGGIPTFCKGWTRLPFDSSSPDLTAHTLMAISLWKDSLPEALREKCTKAERRMLSWLKKNQAADGSWSPLWFGCQDDPDGRNPVYGTSLVLDYMATYCRKAKAVSPETDEMLRRGRAFLVKSQNSDGGWGGNISLPSMVTTTSKAMCALSHEGVTYRNALIGGLTFLEGRLSEGRMEEAEPIGLYFAKLWYSESMYNLTFSLDALKKTRKALIQDTVI